MNFLNRLLELLDGIKEFKEKVSLLNGSYYDDISQINNNILEEIRSLIDNINEAWVSEKLTQIYDLINYGSKLDGLATFRELSSDDYEEMYGIQDSDVDLGELISERTMELYAELFEEAEADVEELNTLLSDFLFMD